MASDFTSSPAKAKSLRTSIRKGDAIAKYWLTPVRLDFSEGFNPAELRRIRELTFEHQTLFVKRWHEHLGR